MNSTVAAILNNRIKNSSGVVDYVVPYGSAGGDIKSLSTAQAAIWNVASSSVESGRLVLSGELLFEVTTVNSNSVIGILIISSGNVSSFSGSYSPSQVINITLNPTGIEAENAAPITLEVGDYIRLTSLKLGIQDA